jgi:hypothetical protein
VKLVKNNIQLKNRVDLILPNRRAMKVMHVIGFSNFFIPNIFFYLITQQQSLRNSFCVKQYNLLQSKKTMKDSGVEIVKIDHQQ